jgi:hypothetical protein
VPDPKGFGMSNLGVEMPQIIFPDTERPPGRGTALKQISPSQSLPLIDMDFPEQQKNKKCKLKNLSPVNLSTGKGF